MLKKIYYFYYNGFREMTVGKKLWTIIIIKLFIMFAILKLFLSRFSEEKFQYTKERSNYIIDQLTR